MKIVFAGDLHIRFTKPRLRKDPDFILTIMKKLQYLCSLGDIIVFTGDLFDRPDPSLRLVNLFLRAFTHISTDCEGEKYFYTIPGNHDLFGGNLETIGNTALGNLFAAGIIHPLSGGLELANLPCGRLYIQGFDWGKEITPIPRLQDRFTIAVVHSDYYHAKTMKQSVAFPYSNVKTLSGLGWNGIVCGHIHYDFHTMVKDKDQYTVVCNPGSVLRLTSYFIDMDRLPKVFVLNTDDLTPENISAMAKGWTPFEENFIPVEPKENIFSVDEYKAMLASVEEVDKFVGALKDMNLNSFQIEEMVKELAQKQNIPDEVIKCVMTYLNPS